MQTTTTDQGRASTGSVARSKWAALAVLSVAQLMVILDTTIVNVALPSIQKALHFKSEADLQWVVNAYVLTAGGLLLLGGRVADRYGRRLVFVSGIVVFAAASLSCGLANSPALLVGSRAVQGRMQQPTDLIVHLMKELLSNLACNCTDQLLCVNIPLIRPTILRE